jgi:uncharacterized coiled-coil protein SlyX
MADTLEQRVKSLEDRVAALESTANQVNTAPVKVTTGKQQSAKEFLLTKTLKSAVQKTLALAYYFEVTTKSGAFNAADLEATFRSAKEKPPANLNDMVYKNIKKGYLMEDSSKKDSKKAWVLTSTGEKVVEDNNFNED